MNQTFKKLQSLLEGKTINKIEPEDVRECICKFVLSDGSAFRLHATDLGYWMEETIGNNGYQSFEALVKDYEHHTNHIDQAPQIIVQDDLLVIEAPDGKFFEIKTNKIPKTIQNIITHPLAVKRLKEALILGDMYSMYFDPNNPNYGAKDLPANCHIK